MTVAIERGDGSVESMSSTEFTRWACLIEAFDFIKEKAEQLGINNLELLVKPAAIEKYMEERSVSMLHDVECEIQMGLI
jgi:hypothetical protein